MTTKAAQAQKQNKGPEHKSFTMSLKALPEEDDDEFFHFEGHAAVFGNVDEYNDVIEKGAFKESIAKKMPKLCYQHRISEPLGILDQCYEDEKGLYVKGRMPKANTHCANVAALLKCGAIDSMSIGYNTLEWEMRGDIRFLQKIKLWEVSFVTIPANDRAMVTAVKTVSDVKEITSKREFEAVLRESGLFSKEASVYLASLVDLPQGEPDDGGEDESNQQSDVAKAAIALRDSINSFIGDLKHGKGK